MRLWLFIGYLALATLGMASCQRDPNAKRTVRFEIPRGKIQRAQARLMAKKNIVAQKSDGVVTFANEVGNKIIFCGAIAVTADDIVADDEDTNPNQCNFTGVTPQSGGTTGENVSFTPGQLFGPIGVGTGTVVQNQFNLSETFVEDDDSGGDVLVEFSVEPGEQRQFNVMVLDINSTQTGITDCDTFLENGGLVRMDTDTRNGTGHINHGANFITVTADVNAGVTEIVVNDEDGNSEDNVLDECCGSLFNETCAELDL